MTKERPLPPSSSLLRRLLHVPLECIPPMCQVGSKRYSMLQPFSGEKTTECAEDVASADCEQRSDSRLLDRRRVS